MSYIIPQIKYLLIISCKQVSPLIVLSINTPKPTRGLDALSISPFLVIDDNPIKAYKKIFNKAFEFSDLVRAPPQYVHMNGIHLKLASHAKIHILSTNETPPKSLHPWSAKQMCDQIIRDAYDRYLTQKQDKRSRSVL